MKTEKKRAQKEEIEEEIKRNPKSEHSWVGKYRTRPEVVSTGESDQYHVVLDENKFNELAKRGYNRWIHTHATESVPGMHATPSAIEADLSLFLQAEKMKNAVIYQSDKHGNAIGYVILRKPRDTERIRKAVMHMKERKVRNEELYQEFVKDMSPLDKSAVDTGMYEKETPEEPDILEGKPGLSTQLLEYDNIRSKALENSLGAKETLESLKKLCNEYGIRYHFIAMPGYKFSKESGNFVPARSNERTLEARVAAGIAIFIFTIILLEVSRLTGFSIAENIEFSRIYSIILPFLFGLFVFYLFLRKKNKKRK